MALSGVMALIAVVGFWRLYFGPLVVGTLSQPLLIHIHATVFTGWLVLFFLQAAFAATRRVQWHMRLGKIGIGYGVLLIIVGLITGIVRASERPLGAGAAGAERLLFVSFADMVMFAGFFVPAIVYRRKPQLHRRLMVVAATTLLVAAVARMTFVPAGSARAPILLAIWALPIVLAMIHDFTKNRSVHPIYVAGIAVLVVRRLIVPLSQTPAWSEFTKGVFSLAGMS